MDDGINPHFALSFRELNSHGSIDWNHTERPPYMTFEQKGCKGLAGLMPISLIYWAKMEEISNATWASYME